MSRDEAAIKNTLDFILSETYEESGLYKKYFVSIQPKELKSKHGHYDSKERKICIFNLSRPHEHTLLTCLHELAHHVDHINRGMTDHEENFYEVLYELLVTALSFKYLTVDDVLSERDSSDLGELIGYFGPVESWDFPERYFEGKIIFSIKTSPEHKKFLKARGYTWYTLSQTYQKVCANRNEAKTEWVTLLKVIPKEDITTKNTAKVEFLAYYYIGVLNGYDYRKELEEDGFIWEGYGLDKVWVKKVKAQDYYQELEELTRFAGIEYKKVTPDLEKERRRREKKNKIQRKKQKKIIILG